MRKVLETRLRRRGGYNSIAKLSPAERRRRGHRLGTARMAKLSPEERSELGRKAANTRWAAKRLKDSLERTGEPPLDDDLVT